MRKFLLPLVLGMLLLPIVVAESSFERALAGSSEIVISIIENEYGLFFLLFLLMYFMLNSIIDPAFDAIPAFKGSQSKMAPRAFSLSALVGITSLLIARGGVSGFNDVMSNFAVLFVAITLFARIRQSSNNSTLSFLVVGVLVLAVGVYLQHLFILLGGAGALLFAMISFFMTAQQARGSPYRRGSGADLDRWNRRFQDTSGRTSSAARDTYRAVKDGASRMQNMLTKERDAEKVEQYVDRLKNLNDDQFRRIQEYVSSPGAMTDERRQGLRDMIDHMERYNNSSREEEKRLDVFDKQTVKEIANERKDVEQAVSELDKNIRKLDQEGIEENDRKRLDDYRKRLDSALRRLEKSWGKMMDYAKAAEKAAEEQAHLDLKQQKVLEDIKGFVALQDSGDMEKMRKDLHKYRDINDKIAKFHTGALEDITDIGRIGQDIEAAYKDIAEIEEHIAELTRRLQKDVQEREGASL
ncbi:hypothetical protein H6504_02730 [Candidatus Woesearchaeota archaeon]|nr:hypothetical protein [Candidatus Woesearchaeota archaeon]